MSRMSIAGRGRLVWLTLRRGVHTVIGRLAASRFILRPFWLGKSERLVIAPQDLRTADATRAAELYGGRFAFAGKIVICDGRSPFEMAPPSDEWADALQSFGWLRHLRAAELAITRANARACLTVTRCPPGVATDTSSNQIAFSGVGQCSSHTMHVRAEA